MFFYNPNIYPYEEYEKRLGDARKLSTIYGTDLITGIYDSWEWEKYIKGLEDEPEGGARCAKCFEMRLKAAALMAKEKEMDIFATTLSISPHKDSEVINRTGQAISEKTGIEFLARDLKKKDGFKKAVQLSCQYNFYRQNYCGCKYSINA